ALERTLPTPQRHGLHGSDAQQADREDEHRHHDFDKSDASHGGRGSKPGTSPTGHQPCRIQHAPPPFCLAVATPPPTMSVTTRAFSAGFVVGMQAVSVCWPPTVPDGRKAISSAELCTSTPPGNSKRRMTAGSPAPPSSCLTMT